MRVNKKYLLLLLAALVHPMQWDIFKGNLPLRGKQKRCAVSKQSKRYSQLCLMLGIACMLGCAQDKNQKNIENYVEAVKSHPAAPVDPIPQLKHYEVFRYSAQNLRSPFAEPEKKTGNGDLKPDLHRRKEELEAFPLDALHIVGTIKKGEQMWALILAPDHLVYRAKVGSYVGQNYGRITKIDADKVDIMETIPDERGWKKRPATMTLTK